MRIRAAVRGSLKETMRRELDLMERAVTIGVRKAGRGMQDQLRQQARSEIGGRVPNLIKSTSYPKSGRSLNAAALVHPRGQGSRNILAGHIEAQTVRARHVTWQAIPTDSAPRRGTDGKRISPRNWPEERFGELRPVFRPGKTPILVADNLAQSRAKRRRGFRRANSRERRSGTGITTVVMFVLKRVVRRPQRLDIQGAGRKWHGKVPSLIIQEIRKSDGTRR